MGGRSWRRKRLTPGANQVSRCQAKFDGLPWKVGYSWLRSHEDLQIIWRSNLIKFFLPNLSRAPFFFSLVGHNGVWEQTGMVHVKVLLGSAVRGGVSALDDFFSLLLHRHQLLSLTVISHLLSPPWGKTAAPDCTLYTHTLCWVFQASLLCTSLIILTQC